VHQLHVVFSYELNLFRPENEKYQKLKEVYAFEFSKESSVLQSKTKPYPKQNSLA